MKIWPRLGSDGLLDFEDVRQGEADPPGGFVVSSVRTYAAALLFKREENERRAKDRRAPERPGELWGGER